VSTLLKLTRIRFFIVFASFSAFSLCSLSFFLSC
jgi:hypothetical protein